MHIISDRHQCGSRRVAALFSSFIALFFVAALIIVQTFRPSPRAPAPVTIRNLDNLPISFAPNAGQANPTVRFMAHRSGGNLIFKKSEIDLVPDPPPHKSDIVQPASPLSLTFEGASSQVRLESGASLPGKANFMLGSLPRNWRANLPTYSDITYRSLYPGVDLSYRGTGTELHARYTLAPGADSNVIRSRYSAATTSLSRPTLDADGKLHVSSQPPLVAKPPFAWQYVGGVPLPVYTSYVVSTDGTTRFNLGPYDKGRPLYVDTTLLYSTYLGGSGRDDAFPIAADSQGNAYIAGCTASIDYPLAQPLQPGYGGGSDVFITKINPAGTAFVYSTYLGGSGYDEAWGLAVDPSFNLYVTGVTSSTNFPTVNPLQSTNHGYEDAFVAKVNPSGSALIYSTYLGGASYDRAQNVAISGSTAYISGWTASTDFPTLHPVQSSNGGNTDIFAARLNASGTGLIFSTYLGGAEEEAAPGIAADAGGNAYIAGSSDSSDFPVSNRNVFQPHYAGDWDAVLAKIGPQGDSLLYSTYLGGAGDDRSWGLVVTPGGEAIVTGGTGSDDFPVRHAVQTVKGASIDVFVTELSNTGSWPIFSTFLGGNGSYDAPYGMASDSRGNIYVAGVTDSTDFPTLNAVQENNAGSDDFFLFQLGPGGRPLIFSTYLGGSDNELGWGAAVDAQGNMYIDGTTRSTDFPTPNALQPHSAGDDESAIAKIAPVTAPTSTPQPCPINFSDLPVGSTFYPYVHYLACDGIITGYTDGTFRPDNNTTRGQLARIVANAADYPNHATLQVFEDVAPGSPFFSQTAELASRGIVVGYPCGRVAESCVPPLNRPYFEPNANVTRGQAAKIAALTAAFSSPPANQQSFQDVPTSDTFYSWVEEMAGLDLINGYPCGGPDEPCVPPLNRPYFRPSATTTRGQVAKIASNTFDGP